MITRKGYEKTMDINEIVIMQFKFAFEFIRLISCARLFLLLFDFIPHFFVTFVIIQISSLTIFFNGAVHMLLNQSIDRSMTGTIVTHYFIKIDSIHYN